MIWQFIVSNIHGQQNKGDSMSSMIHEPDPLIPVISRHLLGKKVFKADATHRTVLYVNWPGYTQDRLNHKG